MKRGEGGNVEASAKKKKKNDREREREKEQGDISRSSSLLWRRMRRGKRRRGLCRGCLVGSSEAPTRCPTAFVWYFINTSANYFPFFLTGRSFVAESGNAPYKPRALSRDPRSHPLFEQLAAQDTRRRSECTQMYANACTLGHACTRPRKCVHTRAGLLPARKKGTVEERRGGEREK